MTPEPKGNLIGVVLTVDVEHRHGTLKAGETIMFDRPPQPFCTEKWGQGRVDAKRAKPIMREANAGGATVLGEEATDSSLSNEPPAEESGEKRKGSKQKKG